MHLAILRDDAVASVVDLPDGAVPDGSGYGHAEPGDGHDEVDVSTASPRPGPGWTWDGEAFSPPSEDADGGLAMNVLVIEIVGPEPMTPSPFSAAPDALLRTALVAVQSLLLGSKKKVAVLDAAGEEHAMSARALAAVLGALLAHAEALANRAPGAEAPSDSVVLSVD